MPLIVIEGLDGSGKATQAKLLTEHVRRRNKPVRMISFPDYHAESSVLVRMYLNGRFGNNPNDVTAYAAGTFYAVDRFVSYHDYWKEEYERGDLIIADRYTTSNITIQPSKLPRSEWDYYIKWTEDLEYEKYGLPRPDMVIYLDVEPDVSQRLMEKRYGNDPTKKDIHESNLSFLLRCRECALYAAQRLDWTVIKCTHKGRMRPIDEITHEIINAAHKFL